MKKILSVLFCLLLIGTTVMPAFAEGKQTITEVRLTVTEPAVGEAPDMTIESAEPDKYTATVRYWIKRLGGESVTTFEDGKEYAMVFEVTPAEGFQFAAVEKNASNFNESQTVVYVNGQKTRCVSAETVQQLGRSYVVTPSSPAEQKPASFFRRVIDSIKAFFAKVANFFRKLFGLN